MAACVSLKKYQVAGHAEMPRGCLTCWLLRCQQSLDPSDDRTGDEEFANAHLIAAVPELLASLEEAHRVLMWAIQESEGRVKQEIRGGWKYHADRIKATIVKAKGG